MNSTNPDPYPYRRLLLLLAACITVLCILPISRLKLSSSITESLGESPAIAALWELDQHFSGPSNIFVLLELKDAERFDAEHIQSTLLETGQLLEEQLAVDPDLVRLRAKIEHDINADIAGFVQSTIEPASIWYLDESHAKQFAQRLTPDGIEAYVSHIEVRLTSPSPSGLVARDAIHDPLGLHAIVRSNLISMYPSDSNIRPEGQLSEDGRILLLQISTSSAVSDTTQSEEIVHAVTNALDRILPQTVQYSLTGGHAIAAYDAEHIRTDIIRSMFLSISAVMAVFFVVYRRISSVVVVAAPLLCSIVWTFALLSLFGMTLTPPIAVGAAMLAGLNADYAIHYLSAWTHAKSAKEAIRFVRNSIIGASFTSILACSVMLFSNFQLIREFAMLGAVGLSCSLIATVTVAPALSSYLKPRVPKDKPVRDFLYGRQLACIIVLILVSVSAWQLSRGPTFSLFQSSSSVLHPMPNPPMAALDRITESFAGPAWTLPVILTGESEDQVIENARLFQELLENDSSLSGSTVLGVQSLLPAPSEIDSFQQLRSQTQLSETNLLFQSSLSGTVLNPDAFGSIESYLRSIFNPPNPPSTDDIPQQLRTQLLAQDQSTYLSVVIVSVPHSLDSRLSQIELIHAIQEHARSVPECTPTGVDVVRTDVEYTLRREFPMLAASSIIAVGLWLFLFFKSPRSVALALIPVLFGVGCLFLSMHAFEIKLDMISLAAIPLLIGIGVDDGIFMVGTARAASHGNIPHARISSRRAIITTSITTAGSFGSLAMTTTPAIQTLGLIVALGVLFCLVGAEFVLDPLLSSRNRKGGVGW